MTHGSDSTATLLPEQWDRLEGIVARYERAWQSGASPIIDDYLPRDAALRRAALVELIHTDMEWSLKAAVPARVEGYLTRFPELAGDRSVLLDLVVAEHHLRSRREGSLSLTEYLERFPQLGGALAARLHAAPTALDNLAQLARPVVSAGRPAAPSGRVPATTADLVAVLHGHNLLPPQERGELERLGAACPDARALARALLERGSLTAFQINRIFQGRTLELFLGPYILLERLGAGGMGQVFKAFYTDLGQVVAVKLLHHDLVQDPTVVRRFRREIRALIHMAHPHVVHALDCGQIGSVHYIAMEYVAGIDLWNLVKQQGPQPVAQACRYVRHAALGLQHAHERGLVHRDIKPSNLILRLEDAVVKVLDLGLARLTLPREAGEPSSTLTAEGTVVGTPDFIAPEQTLCSHAADVRSDVYSLGCTLYFLLAGRVPFPGKNVAEKLLKHQTEDPVPVEELRSEVPAGVGLILRRMLAKQPEARFQIPGEVADVLGNLSAKR
jgi:serine/threonine-protein kinase